MLGDLKDLDALPEINRVKAHGLAECAGTVMAGGLPVEDAAAQSGG